MESVSWEQQGVLRILDLPHAVPKRDPHYCMRWRCVVLHLGSQSRTATHLHGRSDQEGGTSFRETHYQPQGHIVGSEKNGHPPEPIHQLHRRWCKPHQPRSFGADRRLCKHLQRRVRCSCGLMRTGHTIPKFPCGNVNDVFLLGITRCSGKAVVVFEVDSLEFGGGNVEGSLSK